VPRCAGVLPPLRVLDKVDVALEKLGEMELMLKDLEIEYAKPDGMKDLAKLRVLIDRIYLSAPKHRIAAQVEVRGTSSPSPPSQCTASVCSTKPYGVRHQQSSRRVAKRVG
jgi:hypothetical protein